MRRRRQKNPLLMRIIGISILVHIVALPVLAHYGAFKKIEKQFMEARVVVLPPPANAPEKKPEIKKTQHVAHKPTPAAKKSVASSSHAHPAALRSNLNQPKVVATTEGAGAGGDGATVDANGTGKAGKLPTTKTEPKSTVPETPAANAPKEPKPEPTEKVARNDVPAKPITPAPAPAAPEPKKEPVFVEAVPIKSPQPTIPDELRAEALDKTYVAEVVVGPDGAPTTIKMTESTGNAELDRLAEDTARQWRFKPAQRDGRPVESRVRLHIEFQVS